MNTLNDPYANDELNLIARINAYAEVGIDPAFDSDFEELERQFAELRLMNNE